MPHLMVRRRLRLTCHLAESRRPCGSQQRERTSPKKITPGKFLFHLASIQFDLPVTGFCVAGLRNSQKIHLNEK